MALSDKQTRFVAEGFYVYELCDPQTGAAFYVGKGKGRRAWAHEAAVRRGRERNGCKAEAIARLHALGMRPQVRIVRSGLSEREAFRIEREMIAARRDELTNIASGSRTAEEAIRASARADLQRVKPFAAWFAERPRTPGQVDLYHRVVDGLRRIADGTEPLGMPT